MYTEFVCTSDQGTSCKSFKNQMINYIKTGLHIIHTHTSCVSQEQIKITTFVLRTPDTIFKASDYKNTNSIRAICDRGLIPTDWIRLLSQVFMFVIYYSFITVSSWVFTILTFVIFGMMGLFQSLLKIPSNCDTCVCTLVHFTTIQTISFLYI